MVAERQYSVKELRELAAVLGTGEKHDVTSTTPNMQALHGVFQGNSAQQGLLTTPGVRPGMFDATARARSFSSMIPLRSSTYRNEILSILTGVTDASGTNSTDACAMGPIPGNLKVCQQTYAFGILHMSTKIGDITKMGERLNRSDVDHYTYNMAAAVNPWLPQVPGIGGDGRLQSVTRASFYTLGVALERALGPVMFTGTAGTENNTYLGVARQFAGLDALIKTGYVDAINGVACKATDSIVASFNAPMDGGTDGNSHNIVQALSDVFFAAEDRGNQVGLLGVSRALVMRSDQFRALVDVFACNYAVTFCTSSAAGQPVTRDGMATAALRNDMFNGRYLLIDGQQVPVFFDDNIPRETLGNNYYKSDIYIPAMSWAGQSLLFAEYFPMDNPDATEFSNLIGGEGMDTVTLNGGLWRMFKRVTGGCLQYDLYAKVRLLLDAPFLSARLDDVFYRSSVQTRDAQPGFSNYVNGGTSLRIAGTGGAW